jgi:hypothetical protein
MSENFASIAVACLIGAVIVMPIIVHKLELALHERIASGRDWASREASLPRSEHRDHEFLSDDRNREWDIYWRPGGLFNQKRDDDA